MAVSKVKQGLMTLAILFVLTFFIFYAISVFYEQPDWEDYCGTRERGPKFAQTQEQCSAQGGSWQAYNYEVECPPDARNCPQGYCDLYKQCQKEYNGVNDIYERNVFVIGIIAGFILLLLGLWLQGASVSTGIMGGGVLILIVSLARYWGQLSKYFRLIVLAVILGLLIWVGYAKVDNFKEKKSVSKSSTKKKSRKRK